MKYAPEITREYCNFFSYLLPNIRVPNEQLRIRRPNAPNCFSKTGKGEIEGTIHAFIKSREKLKYTQKTKHTVNYDFCCTFILLLRT